MIRDSGLLRWGVDTTSTFQNMPSIAKEYNHSLQEFINLSLIENGNNVVDSRLNWKYGSHKMQRMDFFHPNDYDGTKMTQLEPRGLIVFVHGGAWGSGKPFQYRNIASPFLQQNIAVAIVGYRTWPDGTVQDQVDDLTYATRTLFEEFPSLFHREKSITNSDDSSNEGDGWIGACLMGHSSGNTHQ